MKHEGQTLVLVAIGLGIIALIAAYTLNMPGMKRGADTIGNSIADSLPAGTVNSFWVNNQRNLTPNKHAVEQHGADAYLTVQCYNKNGTFKILRVGNREFHLLCKEDNGTIRDMILGRRSNTSKEFDMWNAFTPTPQNQIDNWFVGKNPEQVMKMPKDMTIFVDQVFIP